MGKKIGFQLLFCVFAFVSFYHQITLLFPQYQIVPPGLFGLNSLLLIGLAVWAAQGRDGVILHWDEANTLGSKVLFVLSRCCVVLFLVAVVMRLMG